MKYKFKPGDNVRVISGDMCCTPIVDKICTILGYKHTVIDDIESQYRIKAPDGTSWAVAEYMLEPVVDGYTPSDRLTDPNTNYKELFKEPMYIEFIDVGEAFDKLKMYEDKEHSTTVGDTDTVQYSEEWTEISFEDIKVGDVVFYPSKFASTRNVRCAKVHEVYPMFIRIEYPSGNTFDLNKKECFKTYEEALAHLK